MSPHLKLATDAIKLADVIASPKMEESELEQINLGVLAVREVIKQIEAGTTAPRSLLMLQALAGRYGDKVLVGITKGLEDHLAHRAPKAVA